MHFGARAYARTVASACASSTESIVNALEHLRLGLADVVIAGGTESAIHPITIASFASMQALSKRNDDPAHASRPYSVDRDGFVMGEGAAALVLETEEHARRAARRSTPTWSAAASPPTRTTSPPPTPRAWARRAPSRMALEAGRRIGR